MTTFNRRQSLALIAVTAVGGTLVPRSALAQQPADAALMPGSDICVLAPEAAEGPYYFDPHLERVDITEGRPGVPITVRLQIVDQACAPLPGARVDLWHCDALGLYSGYPGQGDDGRIDTSGQAFMRGTQFAGPDGIATFETIYPGWYRGRTTHIHFKVWLDTASVLTGQLYFPDALNQFIYDNIAPYSERGFERDTLNSTDMLALRATDAAFAYVKEVADRYLVAMIVGVDPTAKSIGMIAPRGAFMPPPPAAGGNADLALDRKGLAPKSQ